MRVLAILMVAMISCFSVKAEAPAEGSGKAVLEVSSSIVCGMCKDTIEKGLAYTKGIKSVFVNVEENKITVHYKPNKISEEEVKTAINELGYVAGDQKPSKEAYDKLHECCKKEGACG